MTIITIDDRKFKINSTTAEGKNRNTRDDNFSME